MANVNQNISERDLQLFIQLGYRFNSKQQLWNYLTKKMLLFLPNHPGKMTLRWLQALLCNEKQALKVADVVPFEIPRGFQEFSLTKLLDASKNDTLLLSYLPDPEWSSRPIDRQWAYTVAISVRPAFFSKLYELSIQERVTEKSIVDPTTKIDLSENMRQELLAYPTFLNTKCSLRISSVFKSKKIIKKQRQRRRNRDWKLNLGDWLAEEKEKRRAEEEAKNEAAKQEEAKEEDVNMKAIGQ